MCGINGFNWDDDVLTARMNAATRHRGPDDTGTWSAEGISLGNNRLAVIDLSPGGHQPMKSVDGRYVVAYNGEIYNFKELKAQLHDYVFTSESDTEVLLAGYAAWGLELFAKLNGIFAIALWDTKTQELRLVRDSAGIKPLYYFWDEKRLIFSSEIKAILEHDVPRTLDREALMHYLRVLYVPAPLTMFEAVKKVEPGEILTLKEGKLLRHSFAPMAYTGPVTDEALRSTIDRAVERQLVSDRPLGIYLSGGFDSSIILDSVSRVRSQINTFSVGFDLAERENPAKYNTDQAVAKKTAAHYGATHHEVTLSSDEAAGLFEEAMWHLDEPNGNPTALPMLHLARFTKPHATVVCGGDGGDELFGGYPRYRHSLMSTYYRMLPKPMRSMLGSLDARFGKLDTPAGVERWAQFMFQKDATLSRVLADKQLSRGTYEFFRQKFFTPLAADFEAAFMSVDRRSWLVDENLVRSDKMSMAAGVEARVPFLDNEVVAFATRVPRNQKVTLWETKRMLKRAFKGRLPEYLYTEPKRGWFSPAGVWLRHQQFADMASEILSPSYYEQTRELFDWEEVRAMFEGHRSSKEYHLTMLWALMAFQVWAKSFKVRV
jgi:asparagine synthase (glutamine-hydrolysing)